MAYEDRESLETIFAQWQGSLSEMLRRSAPAEASQRLGMSLREMNKYFASCRETPFESLNNAYGGLFPGEMIVCGACPGTGKSAMAHAIMRHLAIQEDWPVFYFGAEMTAQKIYVRQLAALCKIPENDIKKGRIGGGQIESLSNAEQKINAALIGEHIIKDKINAIDLMSRVRKFADETGKEIGLVIVENLQQITWPGKKDKDEIDAVLSALRAFGIEMKIPIYLSAQNKRPDAGKESERPTLDELKGSGNIEEIADKVFLLYRPDYRPQTKNYASGGEEAEVIIAKGGPPIILPFKFFGPCLYWEEAREA
jgi:replicative DNA helicase